MIKFRIGRRLATRKHPTSENSFPLHPANPSHVKRLGFVALSSICFRQYHLRSCMRCWQTRSSFLTSLQRSFMFDYERFRNDVIALGLMALVVFIGLSFMSYDPADPPSDLVFPARRTPINICGTTGASIAFYGRHLLGIGVWIAMAAVIAWDLMLFSRTKGQRFWLTTAGTLLLVMFFCAATQLVAPSFNACLLYTSPSPRDQRGARMPSSA